MRRFKKIIIFVIIAVVINTIAFAFFTVNGYSIIYNLSLNHLSGRIITDDDDYADYSPVDTLLNKNMVFVVENDFIYRDEYDFLYDFFLYLTKNTSIKYITDDIGFSAGMLVNEYIQSGDETILSAVFENAEDKVKFNQYRYDYYKTLCRYNSEQYNKITFFGFTHDQSDGKHLILYIKYLIALANGNEISVPRKISSALRGDTSDINDYAEKLRQSVSENEGLYRQLFTDNFSDFDNAVDNYFRGDDGEAAKMANFEYLYTGRIRGKYLVSTENAGIFRNDDAISNDITKRVEIFGLLYRRWFDDADEDSIYIVKNKYLLHFQKYRLFVDKLNGSEPHEYLSSYGDVYFIRNSEG